MFPPFLFIEVLLDWAYCVVMDVCDPMVDQEFASALGDFHRFVRDEGTMRADLVEIYFAVCV